MQPKENEEEKEMTKKSKGIVFCNTCYRIVGDSFPVWHSHGLELRNEMLEKNIGALAFQYIVDNKKNRAYLARHMPPRNEVTLKL